MGLSCPGPGQGDALSWYQIRGSGGGRVEQGEGAGWGRGTLFWSWGSGHPVLGRGTPLPCGRTNEAKTLRTRELKIAKRDLP